MTQQKTQPLSASGALFRVDRRTGTLRAREYVLTVVAGPEMGKSFPLLRLTVVGTSPSCGLVLTDPTVSSEHLELKPRADGVMVRDLGSTNGTFLAGARIEKAILEDEVSLKLGKTVLRLSVAEADLGAPLGPTHFGAALGASQAMRRLFGMLERISPSDCPVVLLGETGTGKDIIAQAVHQHSTRSAGPFVVFDSSAVSPNLVESELFGHVKGAFTGAVGDRRGAFVQAEGGTLFLDEIGELPPDLQPKLLRALENGMVKRVGEDKYRSVDVRIIAATHRDLEAEVAGGRFRQDLFYRLAVALVRVPPLRERLTDLPVLARAFVKELGREDFELSEDLLARLSTYSWPGNVRELRNVVSRALMDEGEVGGAPQAASVPLMPSVPVSAELSVDLPFKEAKEKLVDRFTRDYLEALLTRHGGNITQAAKAAGIARAYVHRLVARYGLRATEE